MTTRCPQKCESVRGAYSFNPTFVGSTDVVVSRCSTDVVHACPTNKTTRPPERVMCLHRRDGVGTLPNKDSPSIPVPFSQNCTDARLVPGSSRTVIAACLDANGKLVQQLVDIYTGVRKTLQSPLHRQREKNWVATPQNDWFVYQLFYNKSTLTVRIDPDNGSTALYEEFVWNNPVDAFHSGTNWVQLNEACMVSVLHRQRLSAFPSSKLYTPHFAQLCLNRSDARLDIYNALRLHEAWHPSCHRRTLDVQYPMSLRVQSHTPLATFLLTMGVHDRTWYVRNLTLTDLKKPGVARSLRGRRELRAWNSTTQLCDAQLKRPARSIGCISAELCL